MKEYTYNIINDVYNWMISKEKDIITFNNQDKPGKYIKVKVTNKTIVNNIEELLNKFDVNRMMPGHTQEQLKELMYNIYKEELNTKPIVAFEFKYLTSDQDNQEVI